MADLNTIKRVTPNFFFWQGLRFVPFGLVMFLWSFMMGDPPWWRLSESWPEDFILVVLFVIAFFVMRWIGSYYDRIYGYVRNAPDAHRRRDTIKWMVAYPLMFSALILDGVLEPPLFISGLVWAGGILAYWWSTGRGRYHYWVAAGVLVILAFLPLLDLLPAGDEMLRVFFVTLGMIYIVGGILDHLELARILKMAEA